MLLLALILVLVSIKMIHISLIIKSSHSYNSFTILSNTINLLSSPQTLLSIKQTIINLLLSSIMINIYETV